MFVPRLSMTWNKHVTCFSFTPKPPLSHQTNTTFFPSTGAAAAVRTSTAPAGPVLVEPPPSVVTFTNSSGAVVACLARGDPSPQMAWLNLDHTPVTNIPSVREVSAEWQATKGEQRCIETPTDSLADWKTN